MNLLTSQVIIDILLEEMGLSSQAIWIRDQNFTIPNDNGLYIVVGETAAWVMANTTSMIAETVGMVTTQHEINQVVQREEIQIDVLSRSNLALTRKIEVIMALQSYYSQQQQELNEFKIFRIPRGFFRSSEEDGGSIINKYTVTVSCHVWYRKDQLLNSPLGDYYDDFTTRVDDYKTIDTGTPLIEFEINSGGIVP